MGVVGDLLSKDQRLATHLRSATSTSHQIIREESITEQMATTLIDRFPGQVKFTLFTASEEARNGADWYWRIQIGDRAIHARVQAKRVQRDTLGDSDNNGRIDLEMDQLKKLVDSASVDRASLPNLEAWIATFARFNANPSCGRQPVNCIIHGCGNSCMGISQPPSIWMAPAAHFIRDRKRQSVSIQDIVTESIRLDCLLPCIEFEGDRGPKTKGFELAPDLPDFDSCIAAIHANLPLSKSFEGALEIKA